MLKPKRYHNTSSIASRERERYKMGKILTLLAKQNFSQVQIFLEVFFVVVVAVYFRKIQPCI